MLVLLRARRVALSWPYSLRNIARIYVLPLALHAYRTCNIRPACLPAHPIRLFKTAGWTLALRSIMDRPLVQITECFYVDDQERVYFCVGDFIRHHRLPDTPEWRRFIAEDIKAKWPGQLMAANIKVMRPTLLILEEQT